MRDDDLLALACVELAVANWDAEDHPNPIRGRAPFGWVRNAVMLRGAGGTYASQSAKLSASLRRLVAAGLVQRSADGWFDITPAGDQRLADEAYELATPRCGACGGPDGREDLNDVATPSSGLAAGSPRYPICVACLEEGVRESLEFQRKRVAEEQARLADLQRAAQRLHGERT